MKALEPTNLRIAFLTHLHADHTLGLPDLILTPWIMGRKEPLELYGPTGTRDMVRHILEAYDADIKTRTEGLEHSNHTGYKVNVHEITPGVVYKDASVTIKAFNAYHGSPQNTFGYRFETPGRVIVISGDGTPKSDVLQNCNGCDVLIHEVFTQASFDKVSPEWKQYREAFHTSTRQLAEIANKAKPVLLVLYHRANPGSDQARTRECREAVSEEQMLKEIRELYKGKVMAGPDKTLFLFIPQYSTTQEVRACCYAKSLWHRDKWTPHRLEQNQMFRSLWASAKAMRSARALFRRRPQLLLP